MQNLFNSADTQEILQRLEKLKVDSPRQFGRMNSAQMLAHAGNAMEMAMGQINPARVFIGRILGPLFKGKYTDEKPFTPGSPTSVEIMVTDTRDFETEKKRLGALIRKFSEGQHGIVTKKPHPFFGPLTPEEWGRGMFKHLDHHFRQFNG
jgi:hypothetical protein